MLISSVSLLYYACYIHINLLLDSLYLLKNQQENPLGSFKDLSINKDRQQSATLFYTIEINKYHFVDRVNNFKNVV
jgi:hypothetical protein